MPKWLFVALLPFMAACVGEWPVPEGGYPAQLSERQIACIADIIGLPVPVNRMRPTVHWVDPGEFANEKERGLIETGFLAYATGPEIWVRRGDWKATAAEHAKWIHWVANKGKYDDFLATKYARMAHDRFQAWCGIIT